MFRPAARFLIAPRPPCLFAARFLAAVILPPLLFFAILDLLFVLFSPYPNALVPRVVAGPAGGFSLSRWYKNPRSRHRFICIPPNRYKTNRMITIAPTIPTPPPVPHLRYP